MSHHASTVSGPGAPSLASLRAVTLPAEHGGWGLLLEPLVLGLLVAPSAAGAWLAVAAVAAFLARHPARLVLLDLRRDLIYARTLLASIVAVIFLGGSLLAGLGGLSMAEGSLLPIVLTAGPVALLYFAYDVRLRGRDLLPELAGAAALTATASALALAAGWPPLAAFGLWLLVGGRAIASVVEVRARVRWMRTGRVAAVPVCATHLAVTVAVLIAASAGVVPVAATLVPALLFTRACWNMTRPAPVPPRAIGWSEMRAGAAAVAAWAAAYLVRF
jgi:hypothetical protein